MTSKPAPQDLLQDLIRAAKAAGADAADALFVENVSASVSYRLGKLEDVERSESSDLGLRVFVGQRIAFVSSTDFSKDALAGLPERAVAMAKLAPEDKFACLAPRERLATSFPELDTEDRAEPSADTLVERARAVEGAAMAVKGITNSEGGGASFGRTAVALATSEGFFGRHAGTHHSIGVAVLAGEGTAMERDYDSASARHAADLKSPEEIGRRAGERTVARLGPRKAKSQSVPVIFDPRESAGLLGHLTGAISGASIARGVSFLKDRMGQQIFAPSIAIIDDPHRLRGLRSKPFDGEGVANARTAIVENGVLKTWLLDCASAKQLGLKTTGHAARGTGGPPSPSSTNFYMQPGALSPEELMADIKDGFYVAELMGMGVNGVTGDYSRGASGFWIENGKIAYPVSEVTIAGNLKDMYRALTPANDLVFRYGTNAPTCRIEGMTVAGA
ncbi:MAG: TldD/PmbA family protein [Alphaproteobacteria bacterium]|nr:TldD/PmbA family protein [Alphaproteobacteria bacterium]MDE2111206.1 TldD/PmbA family protein [Alphaproteobacteria bacterium]MDE2496024.1 TldD/PmbA family protein [Alphaproteobacteria bacterium]